MIRTVYLYSSGLIEPSPSSWFKPLSYTPHMRPRMGRCGTKTAQNRILKTKTKRKYALTDPFCCQRRQATSWLRQQNAPAQILVHCRCLEKNQDITHAGGPTLSNKISESFGMWCQNDQKCRLPSTETEKIHLSTLNNSPQAQQHFFYSYSPLRWGHGGPHTDSAGGSFAKYVT